MHFCLAQTEPGVGSTMARGRLKGRHRRNKRKTKPKHNSPCTKYQAILQYERVLRLPAHERRKGDVTAIAKSLRIPVTRRCLVGWHAKNDCNEKLKRKEGSGSTSIMSADPKYRNYSFFTYVCSVCLFVCLTPQDTCMHMSCARTQKPSLLVT